MQVYAAGMPAVLDRAFVRASGPDAVAYVQSMVTNDVEAVEPGGGTYALLLTPKARVIADLEAGLGGHRGGVELVPEARHAGLDPGQLPVGLGGRAVRRWRRQQPLDTGRRL